MNQNKSRGYIVNSFPISAVIPNDSFILTDIIKWIALIHNVLLLLFFYRSRQFKVLSANMSGSTRAEIRHKVAILPNADQRLNETVSALVLNQMQLPCKLF